MFVSAKAVSCIVFANSSQNVDYGVCYALFRLGPSDLKLKNEQKEAIYTVYGGRDV